MSAKINQRIGILKYLWHILSKEELVTVYNSIILPLIDYADLVWGDKNNKVLMGDLLGHKGHTGITTHTLSY